MNKSFRNNKYESNISLKVQHHGSKGAGKSPRQKLNAHKKLIKPQPINTLQVRKPLSIVDDYTCHDNQEIMKSNNLNMNTNVDNNQFPKGTPNVPTPLIVVPHHTKRNVHGNTTKPVNRPISLTIPNPINAKRQYHCIFDTMMSKSKIKNLETIDKHPMLKQSFNTSNNSNSNSSNSSNLSTPSAPLTPSTNSLISSPSLVIPSPPSETISTIIKGSTCSFLDTNEVTPGSSDKPTIISHQEQPLFIAHSHTESSLNLHNYVNNSSSSLSKYTPHSPQSNCHPRAGGQSKVVSATIMPIPLSNNLPPMPTIRYATYKKYMVFARAVEDIAIRDKRQIFLAMRENQTPHNHNSIFTNWGLTCGEISLFHILKSK